jgi:hypothetical protein
MWHRLLCTWNWKWILAYYRNRNPPSRYPSLWLLVIGNDWNWNISPAFDSVDKKRNLSHSFLSNIMYGNPMECKGFPLSLLNYYGLWKYLVDWERASESKSKSFCCFLLRKKIPEPNWGESLLRFGHVWRDLSVASSSLSLTHSLPKPIQSQAGPTKVSLFSQSFLQ